MPNRLTRRQTLAALGAALGAPALLGRAGPAFAQGARPQLVMPPLLEGALAEGRRVYDLAVAAGETEFFPGEKTATIGLNQSYLGPILKVRKGDAVRMNVANGLGEPMTLHWHGLNLPAATDGGPHQVIAPASTWSPEFEMRERAGTYWYHGHMMHRTGAHVWAGMAGMIRVEDAEADAVPLPSTHGEDDFTLVLQDRRFTRDFQMPYELSMHDAMAGIAGDTALVNGLIAPFMEVPAGRIRLRLLNGSNASFYNLRFSDGRRFWQVASDGGLLPAPVELAEAILAPGERAEIVVDCDDGAAVSLLADVFSAEVRMMGGRGTADFLELRPTGAARAAGAMPDKLLDLPEPEASATTRRFVLEMGGMGMGRGMMGGGFAINGKAMDPQRIDEVVPVNTTETWVIENPTPMFHPFHIHNTQFRILDRSGQKPGPHEAGLKDTVVVAPGESVSVQVRFADFTDPDRPYMYHCHILEHEDGGMMGQFTVV
ncbi:multicopper oxidase family protein [Ostreiculturibacter nitratireducens]|uniref:multicopper oxidase family protein n=1 Tax=Ostreiculturibacter nitratireducens TaxID=3075226 RepID=UPI0031B56CE2